MGLLVRLGNYISTKPKFMKASTWMFGLPFGVFMAVCTQEYGPWAPVFSLLAAPVAGYFWGLAMWHLHFEGVYARQSKPSVAQDNDK